MQLKQRQSTRTSATDVERAVMAPRRRKQYDFIRAITTGLEQLGARPAGPYGWQLDTIGGLLDIKPYEAWIACRFDDVERAKEHIRFGSLNPYSGKWNWHFVKPTPDDVSFLIGQLRKIQLVCREEVC